jgi:hypothetical protein
MAENAIARNVVAVLADNTLQRSCDATAAMRWTSQRYYDGQQRGAAMTTRWTLQRCCDGRQRTGPHSGVAMSRNALQLWPAFFFFFTPDNLKREKEWEKERSFDTYSPVSRLRLSQLGWL